MLSTKYQNVGNTAEICKPDELKEFKFSLLFNSQTLVIVHLLLFWHVLSNSINRMPFRFIYTFQVYIGFKLFKWFNAE